MDNILTRALSVNVQRRERSRTDTSRQKDVAARAVQTVNDTGGAQRMRIGSERAPVPRLA